MTDAVTSRFPIVGIGASAGGLAALEGFLHATSEPTAAAYVIVTHLSPDQHSLLPDLLGRVTSLPVAEIEDGLALQAGHIYVAPPAVYVSITEDRFVTSTPPNDDRRHPIDFFLRSLAKARGSEAACVILSGSGADGVLGLRAIKEAMGLVLAQDPVSAEFDGMPISAINTGLVDDVLPAAGLAHFLNEFFHDDGENQVALEDDSSAPALKRILEQLRLHSGHDFSRYRVNTIQRRLIRRLLVHRIDDLDSYERFLQETPEEVDLLFRDLLIGVTHFFRDPEAFSTLGRCVETMLQSNNGGSDRHLRAWVAGCATGEEAYSVAITLLEALERTGVHRTVQIFATDIGEEAIVKARAAIYPASISLDVNPERLSRYFIAEEGMFRVRSDVRELVVFAVHSLVRDPPFNHMDLVCCRNVLIYMERDLQDQVLSTFAYSLEPGGWLFLGSSEGVGSATDLFAPDTTGFRIHQRLPRTLRLRTWASPQPSFASRHQLLPAAREPARDLASSVRAVLEQIMPPAVVIDAIGDVLYVVGSTGAFLELPPGASTNNLFRIARQGLQHELVSLVRQAQDGKSEAVREVHIERNGILTCVRLRVQPMNDGDRRVFLVIFESREDLPLPQGATATGPGVAQGEVDDLWSELVRTRDALRNTIEDMEATNEELNAANEEFVSTNEELQSTNEELETSREELQSLNEELHTVNGELEVSNNKLEDTNSDLRNLLECTGIATLFLDRALRIKRYTEPLTRLFNLLPTDMGRPVGHLTTRLRYDTLVADAEQVLHSLTPEVREVEDDEGNWYVLRLLPRKSSQHVVEGLVLTLSDITAQKQVHTDLLEAQR